MRTSCRMIRWCAIGGALVTFSVEAFADVYVSRDANGHLVYSDRKPAGPAQQIRIEVRPVTPKPEPFSDANERAAWQQAEDARAERARLAEQERLAATEERAKRCAAARRQNAVYAYDGRKCSYDANGGRACLSSAEIDAKRAEAKQQMAEFCDA